MKDFLNFQSNSRISRWTENSLELLEDINSAPSETFSGYMKYQPQVAIRVFM